MGDLLEKIELIKECTLNQKKALMAGLFDLFFKLENQRDTLRKKIEADGGKNKICKSGQSIYRRSLNDLIELEKENKKILISCLGNLEKERDELHNFSKVSRTYYNPSIVKQGLIYKQDILI